MAEMLSVLASCSALLIDCRKVSEVCSMSSGAASRMRSGQTLNERARRRDLLSLNQLSSPRRLATARGLGAGQRRCRMSS